MKPEPFCLFLGAAEAFGALSREELESHLGLIPVFMPGLTLKRAGEPRQCQGTALVD